MTLDEALEQWGLPTHYGDALAIPEVVRITWCDDLAGDATYAAVLHNGDTRMSRRFEIMLAYVGERVERLWTREDWQLEART